MHIPVLKREAIECLNPRANENFIDATFGGGGHTVEILKRNVPSGKVLGIEWDPVLYRELREQYSKTKFRERIILVRDSFCNLKKIVEREKFKPVSGILFDLGMSSWHLEKSGRGFSFQKEEPLIMRYDWDPAKDRLYSGKLTAAEIVNHWKEKEILKILVDYGEERFARKIAKEITEARKTKPIETTFQLNEVIKRATPAWYHHRKRHFATKTFQALRIAVNDELNNLRKALPQAVEILQKGGRIVVISFHSLEDRIVKRFFREGKKEGLLEILTKKPLTPEREEIKSNPRARSAKLRAAIKL